MICNTSPLQYLHQLGLLHILPALAGEVVVPLAVEEELAIGRAAGVSLRRPRSQPALPLIHDLGPGETEVLMLALESSDPIVILDDALARRSAETLKIPLTGIVGLLLDAKRVGLIERVAPCLDRLQALRFRLSPRTWAAVLRLAGESL